MNKMKSPKNNNKRPIIIIVTFISENKVAKQKAEIAIRIKEMSNILKKELYTFKGNLSFIIQLYTNN